MKMASDAPRKPRGKGCDLTVPECDRLMDLQCVQDTTNGRERL